MFFLIENAISSPLENCIKSERKEHEVLGSNSKNEMNSIILYAHTHIVCIVQRTICIHKYGVQHYMSNKCATINRLHCWVQNGQYVDHGEWFLYAMAEIAAAAAAGHIKVLENFMSQKMMSWINFKSMQASKQEKTMAC